MDNWDQTSNTVWKKDSGQEDYKSSKWIREIEISICVTFAKRKRLEPCKKRLTKWLNIAIMSVFVNVLYYLLLIYFCNDLNSWNVLGTSISLQKVNSFSNYKLIIYYFDSIKIIAFH